MTGALEEFVIKEFRREATVQHLKELMKPLMDCYDGHISFRLKPKGDLLLPQIQGKTLMIPRF